MNRINLWPLLAMNLLLVAVAVPCLLLLSEPPVVHAVDVSYLQGVSFAVVPLTDIMGDGDNGRKLSATLSTELERLRVVTVLPAARVDEALAQAGVSPTAEPSFQKLLDAGRRAGADILLTGTLNNYLMLDERTSAVSMSLYAINVHAGTQVWADTLTRSFENTAFIDEGAKMACTILVKRMVEEMESQKTAMRAPPGVTPTAAPTPTAVAMAPTPTSFALPPSTPAPFATPAPATTPPVDAIVAEILARRGVAAVPTPPPAVAVPTATAVVSGAPTPSPVSTPARTLTPTGALEVACLHFDPALAALRDAEQPALAAALEHLRRAPKAPALIEGHTDASAPEQRSPSLAIDRALAAKRWLTERGVEPHRVITFGYGARAPVADNATAEGMQGNRRATILLLPDADTWRCSPAASGAGTPTAPKGPPAAARKAPAAAPAPVATSLARAKKVLDAIRAQRSASLATVRPLPEDVTAAPTAVTRRLEADADLYRKRSAATLESLASARIRPSDALRVKVAGHDELERKVQISPTGLFSYALIEDFSATGLTLRELAKRVQEELKKYILNAQIDIRRIHLIKVLGDVGKPGLLEFPDPPTFLDVLAAVGGLSKPDERYNRVTARVVTFDGSLFELDVTEFLRSGAGNETLHFYHGDTLIVEPLRSQKVYVIGAATNSILYRDGMRILDAMILARTAKADGMSGGAGGIEDETKVNIKDVRILRHTDDGRLIKIEVNLHDIIHRGKLDRNVELRPGDYVVIPRRTKRKDVVSLLRDFITPIAQGVFLFTAL